MRGALHPDSPQRCTVALNPLSLLGGESSCFPAVIIPLRGRTSSWANY